MEPDSCGICQILMMPFSTITKDQDYIEYQIGDGDGDGDGDGVAVGDGDDADADKVLMKSAPQGKGSLGGWGVITKTSKVFLFSKL